MEGKDIITRHDKLFTEWCIEMDIARDIGHQPNGDVRVFTRNYSATETKCGKCKAMLAVVWYYKSNITSIRYPYKDATFQKNTCPHKGFKMVPIVKVSKWYDPRTWDWRWEHRWD